MAERIRHQDVAEIEFLHRHYKVVPEPGFGGGRRIPKGWRYYLHHSETGEWLSDAVEVYKTEPAAKKAARESIRFFWDHNWQAGLL